jgi:starch-binding outer membrane protein, SusD/RagB family
MRLLYNHILYTLIILPVLFSCKKGVLANVSATSVNSANVYSNDVTTAAILTGIYTSIMSPNYVGDCPYINSSFYCSLSADELSLWGGIDNQGQIGFYTNTLTSATIPSTLWQSIYSLLYPINDAIVGISTSTSLDPQVAQQALGEAYFMRAFSYFYLINFYGNVPLVTTTNYKINESISRTSADSVWNQIISDLKVASFLLNTQYVDASLELTTNQRLRPTKWAACALLARCYLYRNQWQNCKNEADTVINNKSLFYLNGLDTVFTINSSEAIWQLQSVSQGWNSPDAQTFIIPSTGLSKIRPVYISPTLLNSFEPGDLRRTTWVDSVSIENNMYYFPSKYKNDTFNSATDEYETVLRLGETFLIRAEAEANLGDFNDANADVNAIRNRAGLDSIDLTNLTAIEKAILHERQVELFTEWGHRWFDLKRTNTLNTTMGPPGNEYQTKVSAGTWETYYALYPLPTSELLTNPFLVQNPGY